MFKYDKLFFLLVIVRIKTIKCVIEGRMVKGDLAIMKKFPHAVFLNVECYTNWICGASILNQMILLTAGHCSYNSNTNSPCKLGKGNNHVIVASLGHADLTKVKITRLATDVIVHAGYDDVSVENDLAVLIMTYEIPLADNVKRVVLSKHWSFDIQNGFVAGWGVVNETIQHSPTLKLVSVNQKVRSQQICELAGNLAAGMFCAGSTSADDPRPSAGDSGSALVLKDILQIGIVSFRVNAYPALMVYTNVTYYYTWIKQNSEALYCRNKQF